MKDFAALRNSYVTLAAEAGANVKELQTLARHSTPDLTLNVYAKNRNERLSELAEKIGKNILFGSKCAKSVHSKRIESKQIEHKLLENNALAVNKGNGGGGIRTQNLLEQNLYKSLTILP